MKTPRSPFSPLRTLSLAIVIAGALSSNASADLIAAWDVQNTPHQFADPTPPPWDWHDDVTVSDFLMHGSVAVYGGVSPLIYDGFSSSISFENYVGFTVTPLAGKQMTLTNLTYIQPYQGADFYSWGYRVGDGAWNIFTGQIALTGSSALKNFVFTQPVVTTEAVEFGFFAATASPSTDVYVTIDSSNRNDIQLNGTVAAVPEPSTYALLLGAGAVALILARRRKAAVNI